MPTTILSGSRISPGGATGATGSTGPQGPPGPSGSGTGDMLKSVYDTNSNNIVDAAESVPWTGVTGKPATFSPSPHANTHLSAGSDPIAIATSVLAGLCPAVDNTTIQVVASKLSAVSLAWTAITGRPTTFPPDSTAMLKSVYDTNSDNIVDHAALADTTPWTGITGVPATFAPSAHQASHVTGTDQIPSASTGARGLMAQANNNPNAFYASDATQKQVTYAMLGGSQPGPIAHASTHVTGGTDVIVPASASTAGLLKQLSGNTTDFVDGTNACQNLVAAIQPTIWSVRLRSFQALSNNTFEVDQRSVGTALTNPASATFIQDRWQISKSALTGTVNTALQDASAAPIVIPGTNFGITAKFQRFTVGTAQASLAAGDYYLLQQSIEGPRWRELASDVHSISLLVRSSVASLAFSVSLRDGGSTHSLVKQCTLGAANQWSLIQLANLPVWSGTFSAAPGQIGYSLGVVLAAGTTYSAAASSAWQTGTVLGVTGMSNFLATAGATFDIAYISHEPGAQASNPPIDCPWQQAYDDALRYYAKSYDYKTKPGTVTFNGANAGFIAYSTTNAVGSCPFPKRMAVVPGIGIYNPNTGGSGSMYDMSSGAALTVSGVDMIGEGSFTRLASTSLTAGRSFAVQWTADTTW
jgi:hypothetical protein